MTSKLQMGYTFVIQSMSFKIKLMDFKDGPSYTLALCKPFCKLSNLPMSQFAHQQNGNNEAS